LAKICPIGIGVWLKKFPKEASVNSKISPLGAGVDLKITPEGVAVD
jgi:hypothetical protein